MTMMLTTATRRILLSSSSSSTTSKCRSMSTASAALLAEKAKFDVSLPSYVFSAPAPQLTLLGNGVTVASLFDEGGSASGAQYLTVRIANMGARFDKHGGEHAMLAKKLGGEVGREHISLNSLTAAANLASASVGGDELESMKAQQITKISNSSYDSQMMDHLHSTAYQNAPTGNSLGNFLEGTKESISSLTASSVSGLGANVAGSSVVVVATGTGEHGKLVEEAEKALGSLKSDGAGGKDVAVAGDKSVFIGSDVRIRYDSHKTATIALAFEGASWTDPKSLPLALMTTLLGSFSTSSGLGKNIAANMCQEVADWELASSVSTFNLSYSDTGLFGMLATAPDNKLDDLLWYVMPNFVRLAHGVSDEELARSKAALKAKILSSYDGNIALVEEMARQLQTIGRVMSLVEVLTRVDALTMEDIKTAGQNVINDQDHALAAIGGIHELPDYNWIRRHSYMLRY